MDGSEAVPLAIVLRWAHGPGVLERHLVGLRDDCKLRQRDRPFRKLTLRFIAGVYMRVRISFLQKYLGRIRCIHEV